MFLGVQVLTCHNGSGTASQKFQLWRENGSVFSWHKQLNHMCGPLLWDLSEWQAVLVDVDSFLHHPNLTINFQCMFIATRKVHRWATWHSLELGGLQICHVHMLW